MKEHPILFNTAMVRAILDGTKTQTRRLVKAPYGLIVETFTNEIGSKPYWVTGEGCKDLECRYTVGDRLWVRETWAKTCISPDGVCEGEGCDYCSLDYRADTPSAKYPGDWPDNTPAHQNPPKWKPCIHMPRNACRQLIESQLPTKISPPKLKGKRNFRLNCPKNSKPQIGFLKKSKTMQKDKITTPAEFAAAVSKTPERIAQVIRDAGCKFERDAPMPAFVAGLLVGTFRADLNGQAANVLVSPAEMEAKYSESVTKCHRLETDLREAVAKAVKAKTERAEIEAKFVDSQRYANEMRGDFDETAAKLTETQKRLDETAAKFEKADRQLAETRKAYDASFRCADEMETKRDEAQKELRRVSVMLNETADEMAQTKADYERIFAAYHETADEMAQCKHREAELTRANKAFLETNSTLRAQISELGSEKTLNSGLLEDAYATIEEINADRAKMRAQIEKYKGAKLQRWGNLSTLVGRVAIIALHVCLWFVGLDRLAGTAGQWMGGMIAAFVGIGVAAMLNPKNGSTSGVFLTVFFFLCCGGVWLDKQTFGNYFSTNFTKMDGSAGHVAFFFAVVIAAITWTASLMNRTQTEDNDQ